MACGGDTPDEADSGGSAETGLNSVGGGDGGSDGLTIKLDIGAASDLGQSDYNCDAVDFLFVIDNSSSMAREQMRLIESTPEFTASILTALPNVSDVRVGVVDTDSYPALGADNPLDGCPEGRADCESCDYALGALLTKPLSAEDPGSDCGLPEGQPWMDSASDAFGEQFACVAEVGTGGNQVEQQAGALVNALSPTMLDGGCNDGFLREEALLIILVISDEEDNNAQPPEPQGGSAGDPADWVDAIVAAKGGIPQNVVTLGLIGGAPVFSGCDDPGGEQGAEASPRLQELLESFDTNFVSSVCADDYVAFFDDALNAVADGCEQFVSG